MFAIPPRLSGGALLRTSALAAALVLATAAAAAAGPVLLGGDDLTAHGSGNGAVNEDGWLYIEKALTNLNANVTRTGPFTSTVAALGSAAAGCPPTCSLGDAGAAIGSAAAAAGLSVAYYDGAAALASFFTDLALGTVNPRVIWLAGSGANNDLEEDEGTVLAANATALADFVASGGGLMAHGSGPIAYGWLGVLLPGLLERNGCSANQSHLTAIGIAAFPLLNDDDVASGPCHSHFTGNFGNLRVLALDGSNGRTCLGGPNEGGICETDADCPGAAACADGVPFLIGGGQNTIFTSCGDDVVNGTEECDGTDSAACPGRCLPPTSALACECSLCGPLPDPTCTAPELGGKAPVKFVDQTNDDGDTLVWQWNKGEIDIGELGDPLTSTEYHLCVYDGVGLVANAIVPAGGLCGEPKKPKACWRETAKGFKYKSGGLLPMGIKTMKLKAGAGTSASIKLKGKEELVELPEAYPIATPVTVQMKNSSNPTCWSAVYDENVTQNKAGPPAKFRAKAND